MAIDQKKAAVLVLLDLSAACDTQLLLAYSQLRPRVINICDWAYVFTRIATDHVTTPSHDILLSIVGSVRDREVACSASDR